MVLFDFQQEAVESVIKDLEYGENPLLVMATGTGKTVVASAISKIRLDMGKKILFLAHREELINQARTKLFEFAEIYSEKEMAQNWAIRSEPMIVASVPTMKGQRLSSWKENAFTDIITDEAHHSTASSYKNIYNHFTTAQRLGMTATPDRADKKNIGNWYTKVSYQYPLPRAIREGRLVRIVGRKVKDFSIDLSELKVVAGDYTDAGLGAVLTDYMLPIAKAVKENTHDRKTLIFMPNVASSRLMAKTLEGLGINAAHLSGDTDADERHGTLYRFKNSQVTHLCSCNLFLEGYDEPSIDCIVMLRPTSSRTVYAQAVGRGTRLYPGKSALMLLEFTFNSDQLSLVSPFELFAACGYEEKVRKRAEQQSIEEIDYLAALDESHNVIYSVNEIMARTIIKSFNFYEFDPIGVGDLLGFDLNGELDIKYNGRKLRGMITPKQYAYLKKFNIGGLQTMTKAQASALINAMIIKNIKPLSGDISDKQAACLKRYKIQPDGMTKAQASLLLSSVFSSHDGKIEPIKNLTEIEATK